MSTYTRMTIDTLVDDFLDMNRFSRSQRYQKQSVAPPTQRNIFSRFTDLDKRSKQNILRQERTDAILGSATLTGITRHKQKIVAKARPELLFNQAAALAQRLFAEIARHPEAYTQLSQSETAALGNATIVSIPKASDPKASIRLAAIKAMNQAYPPPNASVLASAVKKVEDTFKKQELQKESLHIRLEELGYSKSEAKTLAPNLEQRDLARFVLNQTISRREDLDSLINISPTREKHLAKGKS